MTSQFSMSYLTTLNCSPPEMTYIAARTGYDFVGFRTISPYDPRYAVSSQGSSLSKDKSMLRETKTALKETGVKLLDLEVIVIYDGVDPKAYLPDFETAAELDGRHILTVIKSSDRNFATDAFSELCELAKPFNLTIDLEFVPWFKVSTLKEAIHIVRTANCENGGILIDPLHFHRSKIKLEELEQVPPEWFHYVQICDAPNHIPETDEELIYTATKERLYVGEGDIRVDDILKRLPQVPYAVEIPHVKRVNELGVEDFARKCLQTAKVYLEHKIGGL